jgi:hypothetical protein
LRTVSQLDKLFLIESFVADFKNAGLNLQPLSEKSPQVDIKSQVQPSSSKNLVAQANDDVPNGGFSYGTSLNRSYKLPTNTPMFMAYGRSCDDWFFVFENAIESSGIPDDMILPLVANYVNGTALQLLKTYMRDRGTSWNKFKQMLVSKFQPSDYCFCLRVQLTNLKQGSDTIVFVLLERSFRSSVRGLYAAVISCSTPQLLINS